MSILIAYHLIKKHFWVILIEIVWIHDSICFWNIVSLTNRLIFNAAKMIPPSKKLYVDELEKIIKSIQIRDALKYCKAMDIYEWSLISRPSTGIFLAIFIVWGLSLKEIVVKLSNSNIPNLKISLMKALKFRGFIS